MSWLFGNFWDICDQICTTLTTTVRKAIDPKPITTEHVLKYEIFDNKNNHTDGIICEPIHLKNIYKWHAIIRGPKHTPYSNGKFYLLIDVPSKYPSNTPSVQFNTAKCGIAYIMDFQEKDLLNRGDELDLQEQEQKDECGIIHEDDDETQKQTKLLYLQEPQYVKNVILQNIVNEVWETEGSMKRLCIVLREKIFNYELRFRDKPCDHYKHFIDDDIYDMNDKYVLDQLRMMCSYNNKHCDADGTPLKLLSYECYLTSTKSKYELFAHLKEIFRNYQPLVQYISSRSLQVSSSNQEGKSSNNQPVFVNC